MPGAAITAFEQLRVAINAQASMSAQQALVDSFVAQHPVSPLIGDNEAIIWYKGPANSVVLRGDMLQERSEPLQRLEQTTFWFDRRSYEPDARLDYHLLVDDLDVGDPRNPLAAPSGFGPRAELRMPRYSAPELWRPRADVPHGTLERFDAVTSRAYPATRTVWVYTPPGFDPTRRYPSVYFHDGGDYLHLGGAAAIFDNMIAAGSIPPCVAVLINPSVEYGRVHDYDFNPRYAAFVCAELVPQIDRRYHTRRGPEQRAIIGASFGGLIALWIAHQRPDVFGLVGSQSGFVSRSNNALIERFQHAPPLPLTIHAIIGTYETHIGSLERGSAEADFVRGNRRLRDVLVERGYRHAYAEYHEGHSWGLWRARLGDALMFLLNP